jgi:hypothetical protein
MTFTANQTTRIVSIHMALSLGVAIAGLVVSAF